MNSQTQLDPTTNNEHHQHHLEVNGNCQCNQVNNGGTDGEIATAATMTYESKPSAVNFAGKGSMMATTVGPAAAYPEVLTDLPTQAVCPTCGYTVITETVDRAGWFTWLIALLLCLFCCWPCCCIPFCIHFGKDVDHYCPNCSNYVGTYKRY